MQSSRVILHSDLNSFYASVEMMLNPQLRGKAVAVCGSTKDRHGIVLAKSEAAKKAGVKTGMVNWQAKLVCPDLISLPPQYEQYLKYSKLVRDIYSRYTNQVEPYGMDECWLDVSGYQRTGLEIAEEIRKTVREELGLTVSIGVSFNKVFAKLGSDMKKPDAVTVIDESNYKETVWRLPVGELLYAGRATVKKLKSYRVDTIGDVVKAGPDFMQRHFGKNGVQLWVFANGSDTSRVMPDDFQVPIKSIGHGITCISDLQNNMEVWKVILELSQDIGHKLRVNDLMARGVQLSVKDNTLGFRQYQAQLEIATQSPMEIARKVYFLFESSYGWQIPIRALTVRAINLVPKTCPQQLNIFDDLAQRKRREHLEETIDAIRSRFGKRSIYPAILMGNLKMPPNTVLLHELIMPGVLGG